MGMLMLETCFEDNSVTNILLMNKENCALKFVDEIILYYDARSKKHQIILSSTSIVKKESSVIQF